LRLHQANRVNEIILGHVAEKGFSVAGRGKASSVCLPTALLHGVLRTLPGFLAKQNLRVLSAQQHIPVFIMFVKFPQLCHKTF
jgi:hypothetical protein